MQMTNRLRLEHLNGPRNAAVRMRFVGRCMGVFMVASTSANRCAVVRRSMSLRSMVVRCMPLCRIVVPVRSISGGVSVIHHWRVDSR